MAVISSLKQTILYMRFYILLFLVAFCRQQIQAQNNYTDSVFVAPYTTAQSDTTPKKRVPLYIQIKVGAGFLLANNSLLSQAFSVPYTSITSSTNETALTTAQNNIAGKNFLALDLGFQIGMGKYFFIDVAPTALLSAPHLRNNLINSVGQTTVGSNIPMHYKQNKFMWQVGATFYETDYSISLGQIDNTNATIFILGQQANPTFYYKSSSSKSANYYAGIVQASQLNLTYNNSQMYIAPKVSFGSNSFKTHFHWAVSIAYNIPVHQKEYVSITQQGTVPNKGTYNNYMSNVNVPNSGISMYNNQTKDLPTPYLTKGFSAMITIGYNFINGPSHRKTKIK